MPQSYIQTDNASTDCWCDCFLDHEPKLRKPLRGLMDAGYRKISWLLRTTRVSGIAFLNENLLNKYTFLPAWDFDRWDGLGKF